MEGRMSTSAQGAPRKPPFYGWWMVWLGGFLSSLNKTAVNKGFPVFVAPVRDGFGASNATVAFIFSLARAQSGPTGLLADRKSTRLNSSHSQISYAVFCLNTKTHDT